MKPVFDTALDAVVAMWADGTVAEWNRIAEQTFGWSRDEAVGRQLAELIVPPQHREAHLAGIARYNATGEATVLDQRLEITALDKSSREFPVELSITATGQPGARLFIGFLRDITRRKRSEEQLVRQAREATLLFQLSQSAADNERVEPVLEDALRAICEVTGWPVGHALVAPRPDADELVSTNMWHHAEGVEFEQLRDATRKIVFKPGIGLPGEVLRRGEPVWVTDTDDNAFFVRKGLGFRAAFAFPLKSAGRTIAVLEFFAHGRTPPDPDLLRTVRALGEQVGRVIERSASIQTLQGLNQSLEQRVEERTSELEQARDRIAQALAEQQRADALYRAYFESSPEALFVIRVEEGEFLVETVNPAHVLSVGFDPDDIRGKRVADILPPDLGGKVIESYRRVLESGAIHQYREVFAIGGESHHWDTTLVPVKDAAGNITHLFGSSRNVSRQVAAEEALRQSQKMEAMGQLTGGVAHDFNNLLTPILGGLDVLQRRGVGGEREQRIIAGAIQSAERAKTLVQRLLAFARRQPLQLAALDVCETVREMGELLSSTLGPRVRLRIDCPPELPPALGDRNQIDMALLNLAVNARDAMPEGGDLAIVVDLQTVAETAADLRAGQYVRVAVVDSGEGMDAATLERCTEPFFSTKGVGQGTGLGLSMVHGLAAQLGGALRIFSRQGVGTTIELWLPATAAPAEADQGGAESFREKITAGVALVVDDEALVRASTASMLEDLGYEVLEAPSAREGLALLECGRRVDVLVTDHLMPAMTGTEFAYEVRERWPEVRILIVSGYAEADGIAPDLPKLTKPFRLADLASALAG